MDGWMTNEQKSQKKVSRACTRCRQLKTCCDEERPCRRCVRLGVEDHCSDAPAVSSRKRKVVASNTSPDRACQYAEAQQVGIFVQTASSLLELEAREPLFEVSGDIQWDENTLKLLDSEHRWDNEAASLNVLKNDGIKCPFLQSSFEMQNAYYSMFDSLKSIKMQYEIGNGAIPPSLFRFLCRHLSIKAAAHGLSADAVVSHLLDLKLSPRTGPCSSPSASRLQMLRETTMDAPIGVIVSQFGESDVERVYCNHEAVRLFGYPSEEMEKMIADPTDSFWMRVWQTEDYRRLFSLSFGAMLQKQSVSSTRGWFNHSSGSKFEAMWSSQFTYSTDGTPTFHSIYITPIQSL